MCRKAIKNCHIVVLVNIIALELCMTCELHCCILHGFQQQKIPVLPIKDPVRKTKQQIKLFNSCLIIFCNYLCCY